MGEMIKKMKHARLFVLFILRLLSGSLILDAQPDLPNPPANLQTATAGSLVIPMDNVNQAVITPFNLYAYGLVNALLQNDIPVKWVIRSGKSKDAIDFSDSAKRIYPTPLPVAMVNFVASAFIIDSAYINKSADGFGKTATQVITSFGNSVAVFQLTSNVTVDVRYLLNFRPKIAVFNNGGNQVLQSKILDAAGIPNYVDISAGVFGGLSACFTFCSEAHWESTKKSDTAITNRVKSFVLSGGNFLAQCYGVNTYENYEFFHSSKGTSIKNANVTNAYFNPDMAYMQFMATLVSNESGAEQSWVRNAGSSWANGFYYAVSESPEKDTVVAGAAHIIGASSAGGNVFYLGGHDYFAAGATDWSNITHINAARLYLNAALIPSGRPTSFIANAGTAKTICLGQSVTLGGTPTGPAGSNYLWQPGHSLNDSTATNPIATPTITTTYGVNVDNGGCPQVSSVIITVNQLPVANAGNPITICPGNPIATLSGSVTNATGGIWSGGAGTFSPNNSTLNATYSPSPGEIASGSVTLTLGTTGSGSCASTFSQVKITITQALSVSITPTLKTVCFGQTAALTASPSGGLAPYLYKWSSGETNQTITNKTFGSYTVTITDASQQACNETASITFNQDPQLFINTSSNIIASCTGNTNISATGLGGNGIYNYNWSTGQNGSAINVTAGTYTITVSDGIGCTASDAITVKSASNGNLAVTLNNPSSACFGGGTSSITALASGGFGQYTYSWNSGESTTTITKSQGTYCMTVRDSAGCVSSACATINEEPQLTVAATAPLICKGLTVPISGTPSGGTNPYTYLWSTGGTSSVVTAPAGSYTLTVTDANIHNCTATATVSTSQSPLMTLSSDSIPTSCKGGADGQASVLVSGGTSPFSYSWSPSGGLGPTTTTISAGTYTVTVTDHIGCSSAKTVTVTSPAAVSVITGTNPVSCFGGSDGQASVGASGGSPGYTYNWSTGSTALAISDLSMATYIITVTDSKGCTGFSTAAISQPAALVATASLANNVLCAGGNSGNAIAQATGGNGGYLYQWAPAGGMASTGINLSEGTYTVTINDSKGCSGTSTVLISQPAPLSGSALTMANEKCAGGKAGTASVNATGGTGPDYSYFWSNGSSSITSSLYNVITSLSAGSYSVTLTDGNACSVIQTVTITEPPLLSVVASPTAFITCSSNVNIFAIASGGTGVFSYSWNTGNTTSSMIVANTGHYAVTVMDANLCTAMDTVSVIALNSTLGAIVTAPAAICSGSSASVSVSVQPGVGPYTYSWNSGETTSTISAKPGAHCATISDKDGCITTACTFIAADSVAGISLPADTACFNGSSGIVASVNGGTGPFSYSWNTGETDSTITKPAGTYILTVTDAIHCSATGSVTIAQESDLNISFSNNFNISCFGGNNGIARAIVAGGKPAYHYAWNATDSSFVYAGLTAGSYVVTIFDARGCIKTASTTLTQPLATLSLDSTSSDVSCFGQKNGSATITARGGTKPYAYSWITSGDTSATENNLGAGIYYAYVTDKNNCFAYNIITITQPGIMKTSLSRTNNVSCSGGSDGEITALVSGGTAAYSYNWSNGSSSITSSPNNLVTSLLSGTYTITITDKNACSTTDTLSIFQPTALVSVPSQRNVTCNSAKNGLAAVSISGGNGNYTYSWAPGGASSPTISNIPAEGYTVQVTDSKGCIIRNVITVTEPPTLTSSFISASSTCGFSNGSSLVSISGGTGPDYTYSWSTGSSTTTSALTDLLPSISAGSYTITITDALACTKIDSTVVLNVRGEKIDSIGATNVSCKGGNNGSATVYLSSGTSEYSYSWSNGSSSITSSPHDFLNSLSSGTYTVNILDKNSCPSTAEVTIKEPALLTLNTQTSGVTCNGKNNGIISANPSGGNGNFAYAWQPGGFTGMADSVLTPGTYTIIVTDAKNCSSSGIYQITEPAAIVLSSRTTNILCSPSCNGQVSISGTGGTGQYSYSWSKPGKAGLATADSLCAGNYCVTVMDANRCTVSICADITEPSPLALNVSSAVNPTCFGLCNGSAGVKATGGSGIILYSWSSGQSSPSISGLCSGNYTVTIQDANNCTNSTQFKIKQPALITILTDTVSQICIGQLTTLKATAAGGDGGYSFSWLPAGPAVSPAVTSTYTVVATDTNGCKSAASTLTVPVAPPISVSAIDTGFCSGKSGYIAANASGGDGKFTFTWMPGSSTQDSIKALPGNIYTVTIHDGCGTPPESAVIHTSTYPNPVVTVFPNDTAGCIPLCIDFRNFSHITSGNIASWNWNFGDSTSDNSSSASHCFKDSGVFSIIISATSNLGCVTRASYPNSIQVYGLPKADFAINPDRVSILNPVVHFYNLSTGAVSWKWNFGDHSDSNNTSYAASPSHIYPDTGTYEVKLIVQNKNLCTDSVINYLVVYPEFSFYVPNAFTPNGDGLNDAFGGVGLFIKDYNMTIFDRWGNLIFRSDKLETKWDGRANYGSGIAQQDVYVYKIAVSDYYGNNYSYVGEVTLLK